MVGTDFWEERAVSIFTAEDSSILKTEETGSFEMYIYQIHTATLLRRPKSWYSPLESKTSLLE
jgi:hypothetical protein